MILIAGAAIGAIGQVIASGVTAGMNAREAAKARKWSKKMYKHRYQFAMEDMKAAGLNPLLLASTGPGNVPSAASANLQAPDIAGAMASGAKAGMAKTQKQALVAQAAQNTSQAGVNSAQQAKLASEKAIIDAGLPKAAAEAALWNKIGATGAAGKYLLGGVGLLGAGGAVVKGAKGLAKMNKARKAELGVGLNPYARFPTDKPGDYERRLRSIRGK